MIVYAESSAVLAWLLRQSEAEHVATTLADAERVVASTLTSLECRRALARGAATGRLSTPTQRAALQLLDDASRHWVLMGVDDPVLERAGAPFPVEPLRTPDAIHLATALAFRQELGRLTLLSLDERIRATATALGIAVAA